MKTPPVLPQNDRDPDGRNQQLAQSRSDYEFDQSFLGYSLVKNVPPAARFDAGYLANGAEHLLQLLSNHAAVDLTRVSEQQLAHLHETVRKLLHRGDPNALSAADASVDAQLQQTSSRAHPLTIAEYESLYPLLPKPASMKHWREDWYFAWQRIAGCNPILLERMTRIPDHFPLTQAHVSAALPSESLDAAAQEGRLFVIDYPMMAKVPLGETDGRKKYLSAPMAAFIRTMSGRLMPVAIQCGQAPSASVPIYTPADGFAWEMAKASVQVAEANFQGIITHLGYCHLVMESTIIAAERCLADRHPLKVLLAPHFQFTLAANDVAKHSLINPGGNTDRLQSGTCEGSTALVQDALAAYPICRTDAPTAFSDRGVMDRDGLPEYPFRDDALESWGPILKFVESYVRLYYRSAEDVAADQELHAWARLMADAKGGNLHRVVEGDRLQTVRDVVMFVARLMYTCTTYHSAINYSSFDFLGYPPNMPAAAWAPGPSPSVPANEEALFKMMTPLDGCFGTMKLMYQIMMTRNHLGKYPPLHFSDPRVRPLVTDLNAALETAEQVIRARNRSRKIPYTYLLPSLIPASIHV